MGRELPRVDSRHRRGARARQPGRRRLQALEHAAQEHARERDFDFWTAAAAVTGDQQLTRHALPPDAPGLDKTVREALRLARELQVDFIDGAQLAMYEHQLADVGVGSDHCRGLRDERGTFLECAQEAEAERRWDALYSELSRRGRMTFDGLADQSVDELADSAPKGDQAGSD